MKGPSCVVTQAALPPALLFAALRFPPRFDLFALRLPLQVSQNQVPSGGTASPMHARWN